MADKAPLPTSGHLRDRLRSSWWQLLSRWGRQLHAYTLVGGLVFLTDVAVYWAIIHWFGSWFLYAHFISRTMGGVACFLLNRQLTFGGGQGCGLTTAIFRFVALYAASFVLSSVLIYLLVRAVDSHPVTGKVVAECTVFLFNYTVMKYWVMPASGNGR